MVIVCVHSGNVAGACRRTLTRDNYVDHENQPYCKSCHTALFGPKGFGVATGSRSRVPYCQAC
jgi:hypothetical protein